MSEAVRGNEIRRRPYIQSEGSVDLQALRAQLQETPELAVQLKIFLHTVYRQDLKLISEDTKNQICKTPVSLISSPKSSYFSKRAL